MTGHFVMSVTYLPLVIWNKHWELDGSRVRCRYCLRAQELTDTRSFVHALGCEAWGLQAQYPSRDLATIVGHKIRLGLF